MPSLKNKQFEKHIQGEKLDNCYLIYGEEKYFVDLYTKRLLEAITKDGMSEFDFSEFDIKKSSIDDISDFLFTFPVLSKYKCVILNDPDINALKKDEFDKLQYLIENIPEEAILLISYKTTDIDTKKSNVKKFVKLMEKKGVVFKSDFLSESSVKDYVISFAKKKGCKISSTNALELIRSYPQGLTGLFGEIEKLSALLQGKEITSKEIEKLVAKNLQTTVFKFATAVINNNISRSLYLLNILLSNKENPITILSVLSSSFVDLFRAKLIEKGYVKKDGVLQTFGADYKGREFKLNNALNNCYRLSLKQIQACIRLLFETDCKLKQTQEDKNILLQKMLVKISLVYEGKES